MQDTTLSSVCYWKGAAWRSTSKFKHSHVTNFLTREKDKEGEETQMPDIFFWGGGPRIIPQVTSCTVALINI